MARRARKSTEVHSSTARAVDAELLTAFVDEHLTVTAAAQRLGLGRDHVSRIRNTPEFRAREDALRVERAAERKQAREAREARAWEMLDRAADGEDLTDGQWRFVDKFVPNAQRAAVDVTSGGRPMLQAFSPEQNLALLREYMARQQTRTSQAT